MRSALVVSAASAALSIGGPDALVPFRDAGAATTVGVAFVLDFGSGAPLVGCVHVPSTDNGYYALAAFTQQENLATPAYNSAGLLCSIGGVPASGCGTPGPNGQYYFWSYWHGATGTWSYSGSGAFTTVQTGDVEGWRFQNPGPDNPTAPAPRAAASYAAICPPTTTPTAPGQTVAPPTPAAATPSTPSGQQPGATPPASSSPGGGSQGGASGATTPAGGRAGGTTSPRPAGAGSAATTSSVPARGNSPPARPPDSGTRAAALGVRPAGARNPGGGSGAAPLAIGAILVLALVAAAVWRWRARPRTP